MVYLSVVCNHGFTIYWVLAARRDLHPESAVLFSPWATPVWVSSFISGPCSDTQSRCSGPIVVAQIQAGQCFTGPDSNHISFQGWAFHSIVSIKTYWSWEAGTTGNSRI